MNGYNTGWKFDRWYAAAAASSGATGTVTLESPATSFDSLTLGSANVANGNAPTANIAQWSIMTHGYNAIRLRFACYPTSGTLPETIGVVQWKVYLVEGTTEEDQVGTHWMLTPMTTIFTNWPSAVGAATTYSSTKTSLLNYQGKPFAIMANTIRCADTAAGTDVSVVADSAQNEAYASQYFYGVLGQDVRWGPSTYKSADGMPTVDVYTPKANFAVYSPGFSSEAATQNSSGEVYINNLAGAARILVVPTASYGYSVINRHPTAPLTVSGTAATFAKSVGLLYNLLQ